MVRQKGPGQSRVGSGKTGVAKWGKGLWTERSDFPPRITALAVLFCSASFWAVLEENWVVCDAWRHYDGLRHSQTGNWLWSWTLALTATRAAWQPNVFWTVLIAEAVRCNHSFVHTTITRLSISADSTWYSHHIHFPDPWQLYDVIAWRHYYMTAAHRVRRLQWLAYAVLLLSEFAGGGRGSGGYELLFPE